MQSDLRIKSDVCFQSAGTSQHEQAGGWTASGARKVERMISERMRVRLGAIGLGLLILTSCNQAGGGIGDEAADGSLPDQTDSTTVDPPEEGSNPAPPAQTGDSSRAPTLAGCPIFPAENIWNVPVDRLPAAPNSADYIAAIGPEENLHPDFGSGLYEGQPIGIPFNLVSSDQPEVELAFEYEDESDPGPYPIPADPLIEGGPRSDGDRHILVLDQQDCTLFELFYAFPQSDGSWTAGSGAVFDLNSHQLRPDGWTSADAAGLPILPGLVRYEEVVSGEINHALRFTAPQTQRAYVWPARHHASDLTDPSYPPMGQRFRLKADFDISNFSTEVQVILRALQRYGMILADNGSPWFISGAPDERWNNEVLAEMKQVPGSAFEAVDTSSLMLHPDSGEAALAFDSATDGGQTPGQAAGGHLTYSLENGTVFRIEAVAGAEPENISQALDRLAPGSSDGLLNISPDGAWLALVSDRFDPECAGWPCLVIVDRDLSQGEAVRAGDELVHPEDFSAVASGGDLLVYPAQGGPHSQDLWVVNRAGSAWSPARLLTADSPFDYNYMPAMSEDGRSLLFDCGDIPYGVEATAICEVQSDGSGFRVVIEPGGGFTNFNQPDYAPDGSIVFEASKQGEYIWRLPPGGETPQKIGSQFFNDNTSCVLPDGRIASLWLDREGGPGAHELKVMSADGSEYFMPVSGFDVFDIGIGCGS